VLLVAVARNSTLTDISHQTIQLHLRLIGASIYEYHTKTGRWPARLDDWAETSLPRESPHWKVMIESGADVMVWHDNLNSDPKDNAHLILAYHNKGLLAWLGRLANRVRQNPEAWRPPANRSIAGNVACQLTGP